MNTEINRSTTITEGMAQYDACAKRLIGQRNILGYVAINTIAPCRGMRPEEAAALIEGDIHIGSVPVDPGLTNSITNSTSGNRIIGLNTENAEINEGVARYDLLFYMNLPNGLSQIMVNIEVQRGRPSGYSLLNRGIYYASRMISSQKERDFAGQNYDKIKNVYSIWICMNEQENSLTDYHLTRNTIMGNPQWLDNPDIIHIVMIGITNILPAADEQHELHRLLSTLFSHRLTRTEKLTILEQEYHLPATIETEEEANEMCNLAEGIVEDTRREMEIENVTNMYSMACPPDKIAGYLKISVDEVLAILTQQGLIQA